MKKLLVLSSLIVAGTLSLQPIAFAHGGVYHGPGDTVPPGGSGGGGGAGPSVPGGAGPTTGGPSGPAGPGAATGGVGTGGPARGPGPSTGPGGGGSDLTTWEFWWGFNKDAYLNLKFAVQAGLSTDGEDYFLAPGAQRRVKTPWRPSEEAIRGKVVPALKTALEKERANDIVTGAMIALAKIGDARNEAGESEFEGILSRFLSDPNQEIHETAAFAIGILGNDSGAKLLTALLQNDPHGRVFVGNKDVDYRTRAFAAYGLGLIGSTTASKTMRQEIAAVLSQTVLSAETAQRDVRVAALTGLGLVPIDVDVSEAPDARTSPSSSRQGEIQFVLKYFLDNTRPALIRAHAPTALARLLIGAPAHMRETCARAMLTALGEQEKESNEIQQSCVLALGQIATSEKTKLDIEIRETLKRIADSGKDQQSKCFALIALGQIGGRCTSAESCDEGMRDVRTFLLTTVTKGKTTSRPWAAMAVGVMEHALLDNPGGAMPSAAAKEVLREAFKACGDPEQIGALAIAEGIARDVEAQGMLREKLHTIGGDDARGYIALGLGLMGAHDSLKDIQTIVRDAKYKSGLMKQAAIALGLLGDKDLVPELTTMLADSKALASQASIASALGFIGDSRSIDPLSEMLKNSQLTQSARGFAAAALGIVSDRSMLPCISKISANINYRANTATLTDSSQGTGILDIL
jgi:HEAT repeat protein